MRLAGINPAKPLSMCLDAESALADYMAGLFSTDEDRSLNQLRHHYLRSAEAWRILKEQSAINDTFFDPDPNALIARNLAYVLLPVLAHAHASGLDIAGAIAEILREEEDLVLGRTTQARATRLKIFGASK